MNTYYQDPIPHSRSKISQLRDLPASQPPMGNPPPCRLGRPNHGDKTLR